MRHQIGPGQRTLDALHNRIADAYYNGTPSAARARAVVARRRANWSGTLPDRSLGRVLPTLKKGGGQIMTKKEFRQYNDEMASILPRRLLRISEINTGVKLEAKVES